MDNSIGSIADQTWECYKTVSDNVEHLEFQINDIVKDYVLGKSVKLEECIKLYVNENKKYMLASWNVQEKPKLSGDAYSKECWVSFYAEKQANNYTVYVKDFTKNNSGVIARECLRKFFLDKLGPQKVKFVSLDDNASNESLSWALGYLRTFICSSRDSFLHTLNDCSLENCLSYDKLIITYGLGNRVRAKSTLIKILNALYRILTHDKTYCPLDEELVNLTAILVSKNFSPQEPNEKDIRDEVIKILCRIEAHTKVTVKCLANICSYFHDNKNKYKKIMHRHEMEFLRNGISEVKGCLSLAVTDWLAFSMASVQLIPKEKIGYEMLNELVAYLNDKKIEHLMLQKQDLEEKIWSIKSKLREVTENKENSAFHELIKTHQQLNNVKKQLNYNLDKAEIVKNLDTNELLLLLSEKSKHPCNCLHMLNQETVNMLIENTKSNISEGTSLALVVIIASLPKDMKMTLSIRDFLFDVPQEGIQWTIQLGLHQKLVTEDIEVLCEIMYDILINSEEPSYRSQAVNVLEMNKEHLSKKAAELLELESNYTSSSDTSVLLKYVEQGRLIPQIYFYKLVPLNEKSMEVLEQLTESGIQKLPELIIRKLKSCISESSDTHIVLRSFKLLVKLGFLTWSDPKIRDLLRNPMYTEHILQHILNSFVIEIPEVLLKEIRTLPKKNLTEQFFNEVQRNDISAKLKNPNIGNEHKKKIIKSITNMELLNPENIELLENIIKCNDNLRAEAFQALIKMVPEYNINNILQYLDIRSLTKQDMVVLTDKHCNLIPLLNEIIKSLYNTNTDHEKLSFLLDMTLISELPFKQFCLLLNFVKYSNSNEVRSRIKRFILRTNYGKEEIIDIMQYVESLEESLQTSLQSDPELKTLHHCVEDGYGITEELLLLLTEALQSKIYLKQKIENILFKISQHQEIPRSVWDRLFRIINAGNDSNLSPEFIAFVANTCQKQLSKKALNLMFRQYENSFSTLCGIGNYAKERNMPSFVLHQVGMLLINPNENIETRTLAAAILANQEERCVNLQQIITVKLQQEFLSDLLCSKISQEYHILLNFLKDDDQSFHEKFYALRGLPGNQEMNTGILWKCCINYCCSEISKEYKLLLKFVRDDNKSFHEKFYVLHSLSCSEAVNKEILRNFSINDWRKEFFSYSLLSEMMQWEENQNEFQLKEFRENLNKLHQLLGNNYKTHTSEAVYEALLQKQRTFAFRLRDGINVLIMLQSNPNAIDLLFNSSENFVQRLKLFYSLQMIEGEPTRIELDELSKYLVFKTTVMEHFLNKLRGRSPVQQLTEFFQMLMESNLPFSNKEEFLMDGTDLLSANEWKSKLAQLLAENILQNICYKINEIRKHKQISKNNKSKFKNMKTVIKEFWWGANTSSEQCAKWNKNLSEQFLTYLLLSGWSEKTLSQLVHNLDTEEKLTAFLWVLIIIYDYQLTICTRNKEETLTDVLKKNPVSCWEEKVHEMALCNSFRGTHVKTETQLIEEICDLNKYTELEYLNQQNLQTDFKAVMDKYNNSSALLVDTREIIFWEGDEIKCWAVKIRQDPQKADLLEKIAVMKRAVEISCGFTLRDIQILTVLILLQANEKNGCLAQVNTGEGKTVIIAMIAAILSLNGHTVDVVSSSPELARPQLQEMQHFFKLMELKVAHNTKNDEKTCYKADIVYGAASSFQGDILRDEYNQLGIRCGRSCDIAVVDEVDSMLIDNRNYKVMLSSPMPAMNHLEPILAVIWVQIDIAASLLVEENGLLLYKKNADELIPIKINKEEFIKICARKHIRKLIGTENLSLEEKQYPKLKIPKHLMRLVNEVQLDKWIDCAFYAKYSCEHDKHYIIKDNKIIPVDVSNTGVVQKNMHWNDGLHQFLQIKHGLRITPESLCTNFISNVAYFQRYNKIYGLTGTLGSTNAINLLKEVYNVSNVYLPPFKKEQHLELKPIIAKNEREHHESIVMSSLSKLKNGRAVLIITKYIAEAKKLYKMFVHDYDYKKHKVKTYMTENDSNVIKEKLGSGEVVIATNIAGRGTDIKLEDEVEQHGGLHICVTFLPSNLRTEKQNIGRTSRMGHRGTSQFIILNKYRSITEIRKERDEKEETALKNAKNEIKNVNMHDEMFAMFCELLNGVRNKDDKNNDVTMKALEERFALWFKLHHRDFEEGETKNIMQSFELFKSTIKREASAQKLIKNPYFHVQIGNRFLEDKKYDEAIYHYTEAINMDPDFGENAYFNRGYACIAKYGCDCKNNKKELNEAVDDFRKAKDIIQRCEEYLHIMQLPHSEIMEQVCLKREIYAIQKGAIDRAIGVKNEIRDTGSSSSPPEENRNYHKGIILEAIEKEWNLTVAHQKLQKVFQDADNIALYEKNIALCEAEIKESENNGCIGSFEVKMIKPPINWWNFVGLTSIGILQIIVGVVLGCLGLSCSEWLILGGIDDITCAIKNIIRDRNFDWKYWGIKKCVSLVTSVVVSGCSTIKNIATSCASGLITVASNTVNCAVTNAKRLFQKQAKVHTGQLNELVCSLIECDIIRGMLPTVQDAISSGITRPLEDALVKLLSDECQEEFIRKILEGLLGNENIEKYAINIAAEIIYSRRKCSALNSSVCNDIKDLKCISNFIGFFISEFKTEVNSNERSSEVQEHKENNHTKKSTKLEFIPERSKALSEEMAAQVSAHVTMLVEEYILSACSERIKINIAGHEVLMEENEDDDYNKQYNTEVPHNEINECLQKSTIQEILVCLSDVAKIPIRLMDKTGKWLHTIGKDKVGTPIKLTFNETEIEKVIKNNWLFKEVAKLSGIPENKLNYLVMKQLSVQEESKLKERAVLKLYKEEFQRIPKMENIERSKLSYLCREQYNQIAYRAFSYNKLDETSSH